MAAVQEAPSTDGEVVSQVAEVEPFVTIGVALPEAPTSRSRSAGVMTWGWSDWHELEVEVDKGPDQSTDEGARPPSTATGS